MPNSKKWYKRWWAILLLAAFTVILIFFIAFSFYVYALSKQIKSQGSNINWGVALKTQPYYDNTDDPNNPRFGSADAPITIVEFVDFNCPVCAQSYNTVRRLGTEYNDYVKIIHRDYPVNSEDSLTLALAGRCAYEQNMFWPFHDKIFQSKQTGANVKILSAAGQIGLDMNRFQSCLTDQKYLKEVKKDLKDGLDFEIKGTPAFFINGHKINGNIPYNIFEKIIQDLIPKNNN
jgi:protein-disulfide isomerase